MRQVVLERKGSVGNLSSAAQGPRTLPVDLDPQGRVRSVSAHPYSEIKALSMGSYFSRRWHGEVPLGVLVWQDMLGVGTLVNLTATFLAVVAVILGAHSVLALAVHLSPLPFNVFLVGSVWRAPAGNTLVAGIAALWFCVMMVI
jgi:hypothetical protein